MLTGGFRKGRYKFAKDGRQTVAVVNAELDAWLVEEEKRTGTCRECKGNGKTLLSWSLKGGPVLQSCGGCGGSGNRWR